MAPDSTDSHLSTKSRLNVKLKINNIIAHVFWHRVHIDTSRSSNVVDFGTYQKRVLDFLLDLNSNLIAILPSFRDITAFVRQKPLFQYLSHIPANISGRSPWSRSVMLKEDLQKTKQTTETNGGGAAAAVPRDG